LKPDLTAAYRHLVSIRTMSPNNKLYIQMQAIYLDLEISEEQRCHINFALAKVCEDLGNYEQAFKHYIEGNALRKKLLNYHISKDIDLFKQIKSSYIFIKQSALNVDNLSIKRSPVFIVGMPRSGTTLVEQIISSHPQVTGAGELSFAAQFGAPLSRGLTLIDNDALNNFRKKYLAGLQNISQGNLTVTDKMPNNFLYLGLIAAAFPEAKIVHVKRNPAAVCWANYKQYFEPKGVGYYYDLDDVVSYYRLYENLMEFWMKSLSKRIYKLDYEVLTINQEDETRKLIDYVGLDWDEKCLSPQNNTRAVLTASDIQVRKKVYQGSSQQWEKYKPFLSGALDCFDEGLVL